MTHELPRVPVGHGIHQLESLHDLRPIEPPRMRIDVRWHAGLRAELAVSAGDGRMTVQAIAELLEELDAFGFFLIGEHVGVAAFLAVVHAEGISIEDGSPRREFIDALE